MAPSLAIVGKSTFDPCPRVEVTISGLTAGSSVVNVWRTADGKRQAVRGGRKRSVNGSDFVVDYEVPQARVVSYDLEIVSGPDVGSVTPTQTVVVDSGSWVIQDPLTPGTAMALAVTKQDSSRPYLTAAAVKSLEYNASVSIIPILGSPDPVALMGQRLSASNVSFDMFTNMAQLTTQLRNLLMQAPLLLVRPNGTRNNGIPGLAYFACAKPVERPVTVAWGGTLTNWGLQGDLVAAPTMNVLVPVWTYGTVKALFPTYQAKQTAMGGKTYLDDLKSPSGV